MDIKIPSPTGQFVPVRNVAEASFSTSPTRIARTDRQPTVSIGINISGRDSAVVNTEVREFLATVELPPNVEAKMGGDAEIQAESFTNLSLALLLSIVFVYMVLASQFGSFIQPLLIMIAMPLAIIGAVLALLITGKPLDMTAFIGFIMLMGSGDQELDSAGRLRQQGAG